MAILKAGVVGAGAFGSHHARKYAEDSRVELVGLFDSDAARAATLATQYGVRAFADLPTLLDSVEVVTIASPPSTHGAVAEAALESRCHVLVEKPLAATIPEGERVVQRALDSGLTLACGHQERLVFEAMGILAVSSTPERIETVREGPWTGRSADVSVTLDLMVHDIDLVLRLMGGEIPHTVEARGRAVKGAPIDEVEARLIFANAEAVLRSSRVRDDRRRSMNVAYANGALSVDFLARSFDDSTGFSLSRDFAETPAGRDPLGANVTRFIDAATGSAPRPAVTGAEALDVLKVAIAIDAAAERRS